MSQENPSNNMYSAQSFDFDQDDSDRELEREDSDGTLSHAEQVEEYDEEQSVAQLDGGVPVDQKKGKRCTSCSSGRGKVRIFFIVLGVVLVGLAITYLTLTILKRQGKFDPPVEQISSEDADTENENDGNTTSVEGDGKNTTDIIADEGNLTLSIERLGAFVDRVQEVTEKEVLLESGSPQNQALIWIVRDDERQVEPDHPNLIQRYALATLYFATQGPSWGNTSKEGEEGDKDSVGWLTAVHECEWDFTSCSGEVGVVGERRSLKKLSEKGGRTKRIRSHQRSLEDYSEDFGDFFDGFDDIAQPKSPTKTGADEAKTPVEVDLGTLTEGSLTAITLQAKNLAGNIPAEIGALERLEILDLGMNDLTGPIPVTIGTMKNLHTLKLNDNSLNGTIPESIGNLPNLEVLRLESNNLTGSVPPSICSLELVPKFGTSILKSLPNVICSCCSEEDDKVTGEMYSSVPASTSADGTVSPCDGDECLEEEAFTEEVSESADLPTEEVEDITENNEEGAFTEEPKTTGEETGAVENEEGTNAEETESSGAGSVLEGSTKAPVELSTIVPADPAVISGINLMEGACASDFEEVRTQKDGAVAVAEDALMGALKSVCDPDTLCEEDVEGVLVTSFSKLQETKEYSDFVSACQAYGDGYRVCTIDSEYVTEEISVKLQARPVCAPLSCKTEDDLSDAITPELSCQGKTECTLTSLKVKCFPEGDLSDTPSSRGEN